MLRFSVLGAIAVFVGLAACSSSDAPAPRPDAGDSVGGTRGSSGGAGTSGVVTSSGGAPASGGATGTGGRVASGGSTGSGGSDATGGSSPASGGTTSTGGRAATACPASDEGNVSSGRDTFVPNTGKQAVDAITYTNVGATGAYEEVASGWSKATGCNGEPSLCETQYKRVKQVSGALAPFNEEMTLVFAGPVELYQIAVYAPAGGEWTRRAYWDRCTTEGLVFAGNKHWFECNGFVESYVTADGTKESATPVQFAGKIAAGTEVHVMSDALCNGSTADSDCGYSSGLPIHGFRGDASGSKIFATKFRMPIGTKTPAYWILPSQVVRSSQYGCNCRGMGSDPVYKGGCGELDVAEILGGVVDSLEATTTLYSFQDITGGGSVTFNRPVQESATFLVIFDAPSRQIAIRRLGATAFDFAGSLPASRVAELLDDTGAARALD